MKRCNNWPGALSLFIAEKRTQPFKWGENDCCLFAADWLTILTGTDPAEALGLRGKYDSAFLAARLLESLGGVAGAAGTYCAARNWPECPICSAGRGDLILYSENGRDSLGVCLGARSVFVGESGLEFRSTSQCLTAWRVG